MPDLRPYRPSGWDNHLVLSTVTGTNTTAGTIYDDETVYIDFSCANYGDGAAGPFRYAIYIDGILRKYAAPSSLAPWNYSYVSDSNLGTLTAGEHEFRLICDYQGVVTESDESNNEYARSFTITHRDPGDPDIRIAPTTVNFDENGDPTGFAVALDVDGVLAVSPLDLDNLQTPYVPGEILIGFAASVTAANGTPIIAANGIENLCVGVVAVKSLPNGDPAVVYLTHTPPFSAALPGARADYPMRFVAWDARAGAEVELEIDTITTGDAAFQEAGVVAVGLTGTAN